MFQLNKLAIVTLFFPLATAVFGASPLTPLPIGGTAVDVKIAGEHAFVAAGAAGLVVIDLTTDTVERTVPTSRPAVAVDVETFFSNEGPVRRIYVMDNQIHRLDPRTFAIVHSVPAPEGASGLRVLGDRGYMFAQSGFVSVDLETGEVQGRIRIPGMPGGFDIAGGSAYVGHAYPGGLEVVDLFRFAKVQSLRTDWLGSVTVRDDRAYVTTTTGQGVQVLDLRSGAVLSSLDNRSNAIATTADRLLIASGLFNGPLEILDRQSLRLLASIAIDGSATGIAVGQEKAVVTLGDGGLAIVDLSAVTPSGV